MTDRRYFPNDTGPERTPFKMRFYQAMQMRVEQLLALGRQVIIAGTPISAFFTENRRYFQRSLSKIHVRCERNADGD
jgi:exonuclease III